MISVDWLGRRAESERERMREGYEHCQVPDHLREGLEMWVTHGVRPGGFLCAVLRNDLTDAVCRADSISAASLDNIVRWVHNFAPGPCHGSEEQMQTWAHAGGVSRGAPTKDGDRWVAYRFGSARVLPAHKIEKYGIDAVWDLARDLPPEEWERLDSAT